jgi:hypothetical protein
MKPGAQTSVKPNWGGGGGGGRKHKMDIVYNKKLSFI